MMDSPLQQLEASGRLESLEPFKVKVEGRQSGLPFSASAMVDPSQKLAVLRTSYDLDNPDNVLELQASFYNDTFIQDNEGFLGDKLRTNAGAMLKAIDSLSEAAK